jgi:hypothetical protein
MSRTISAVVDDELAERIDAEREGEGPDQETRSEVIGRLLEERLDDDRPDYRLPPHLYAAWLGAALFLVPLLDAGTVSGAVVMGGGALLFLGGIGYEYVR